MMTYAFMPDDVWTKVSVPGYLGSGTPFYYLNISRCVAFAPFSLSRAGVINSLFLFQ